MANRRPYNHNLGAWACCRPPHNLGLWATICPVPYIRRATLAFGHIQPFCNHQSHWTGEARKRVQINNLDIGLCLVVLCFDGYASTFHFFGPWVTLMRVLAIATVGPQWKYDHFNQILLHKHTDNAIFATDRSHIHNCNGPIKPCDYGWTNSTKL